VEGDQRTTFNVYCPNKYRRDQGFQNGGGKKGGLDKKGVDQMKKWSKRKRFGRGTKETHNANEREPNGIDKRLAG